MAIETSTPIELLAEALATMTARADKAERERDAAKKDAANWYDCYMTMKKRAEEAEKRIKELEDELAAVIAGNETLCKALENAAQMTCPECCPGKTGEQNNG